MAATDVLDLELEGLDRLELDLPSPPSRARCVLDATWPKLAAIAVGLALWEAVVLSGWKPTYVLPGPGAAFSELWTARGVLGSGALTTLQRAVEFYLISLLIGTVLAAAISRVATLRTAVSPLLTGLQTMPNVAWVPFAIIVWGSGTVRPIMFVAVIGTVPAITIGTLSAIDAVPPLLLRAGDVLGARGLNRYRHVVLPAAMPGYVAGMRQGWAFLWRALMAGELIAQVPGSHSLGQLLSSYQDLSQMAGVLAAMLVILAIGLLMDTLVFTRLEAAVLRRRGLTAGAA